MQRPRLYGFHTFCEFDSWLDPSKRIEAFPFPKPKKKLINNHSNTTVDFCWNYMRCSMCVSIKSQIVH